MSVSTDWAIKCQCRLTGHGNVKEISMLIDWNKKMSVSTDWARKCQCQLTGQGNVNVD